MSELADWRSLEQLAARMAAAAEAADWDQLIELDHAFHAALRAIQGAPRHPLNAAETQEKTRLITTVLNHQHIVRDRVEPWLQHVQPLLAALVPHSATDPSERSAA